MNSCGIVTEKMDYIYKSSMLTDACIAYFLYVANSMMSILVLQYYIIIHLPPSNLLYVV